LHSYHFYVEEGLPKTSNNSSPSLIVTLTPTGCMMPWSKLGGIFQVYIKFLH
jgi:hypothetical protein